MLDPDDSDRHYNDGIGTMQHRPAQYSWSFLQVLTAGWIYKHKIGENRILYFLIENFQNCYLRFKFGNLNSNIQILKFEIKIWKFKLFNLNIIFKFLRDNIKILSVSIVLTEKEVWSSYFRPAAHFVCPISTNHVRYFVVCVV